LGFFQTCWEVLKEDIMAVFREFHGQGSFEKSIFISLIPKKVSAVDIKDFRPINPVGWCLQNIYKVLANKLKQVLEKIISNSQNAFIKRR
jgi:hypothetical protein